MDATGRSPEERSAGGSLKTSKSILIVDDQEDERAIQRAMLEHLGYRVEEAADGEEALARTAEFAPDLILLDIAMPRLDGLAVCRALRADPKTAGVRILFYTASPSEEWEHEVAALGADGVLVKPVDPHQVATEVRRLIGAPGTEEA